MLHGWSMNSTVWHELVDKLAENYTLYLVDLPGHGYSTWQQGDFELDVLLEQLAIKLPSQAYFLGWSLGGLIGLALAHRFPEKVAKLILLAATPCFVQTEDWACAMQAAVFQEFAAKLEDNQAATLQRFLALQARGSKQGKETIKALSEQLAMMPSPNSEALKAGLSILINKDLRTELTELSCPVKIVLGERDTLIPTEMMEGAKQLNPSLETVLLIGAGHAPFISHVEECQNAISEFFTRLNHD
jgi:pimeloyl-[acyl-carrier protein] methyl ester esterase